MFIVRNTLASLLMCLCMGSLSHAAAAAKTCIDCHKKIIAKRSIHAAIGQYSRMEQSCESCHSAPHAKQKGTLSLVSPVPDLCFMCHDKADFTKDLVHPPVAGGDCLACHNPHASDISPLLTQPIPFLCQNCHPDKTTGKHVLGGYGIGDNHPIQGRIDPTRKGRELGCASCHKPHSSRKKNLLVNDDPSSPASICMVCHTRITVRP